MIMIELLASKAAVQHIINSKDDNRYLFKSYQNLNFNDGNISNTPIQFDAISKMLFDSFIDCLSKTSKGGTLPSVSLDYIRLTVIELSKEIERRKHEMRLEYDNYWPAVRQLIEDRAIKIERIVSAYPGKGHGHGLALDPVFFRMGSPQVPTYFMPQPQEGDAHVHIGGAVPWDSLWTWLMNRDYPPASISRAQFRWHNGKEAAKLLNRARECRETLLKAEGLWQTRRRDPACDAILFNRLRFLGKLDSPDVRDYVLVRCMMRREMLCDRVDDLDDFTGAAWRRFWGQKGQTGIRPAMIRRQLRVEKLRMETAVSEIVDRHGVGIVSFRTNLDTKSYLASMTLRDVVNELSRRNLGGKVSLGLTVHAQRPKKYKTMQEIKYYNNKASDKISFLLKYLSNGAKKIVDLEKISLDLAGPEKSCDNLWFSKAISRLYKIKPEGGLTLHAGEDFYDPWHGLWRVYKIGATIKRYPRIGHGSILGINPYHGFRWTHYKCPIWVRKQAIENALQIIRELSHGPNEKATTYLTGLKQQVPSGKDGTIIIEVTPDSYEKELFFNAQRCVLEMLQRKCAFIETNPTSNYAILGASGYEWLPVWGLCATEGLTVLMGTDDPGLFHICIEEEYTRLAAAFEIRKELENMEDSPIPKHLRVTHKLEWQLLEKQLRDDTRKYALMAGRITTKNI